MLKEAFCTVIKDLRVEHKMTREKLAELSSLDATTIYRIETAKKLPTTDSIFKLAAAFGISTSALIEKVEIHLESKKG